MTGRGATLLCLALAAAGAAARAASPSAEPVAVGLVPFADATGEPEAVPSVMAALGAELARRGIAAVGQGPIEALLRERRIRTRSALSFDQAALLAERVGVRYLVTGTVDAWTMDAGPQVAVTALVLDAAERRVAWAGSVSLMAPAAPGLLALGRPGSLDEGTTEAVRRLCKTLPVDPRTGTLDGGSRARRPRKSLLAESPIAYRGPAPQQRRLRVALLPLDNRTTSPQASVVVGNRLFARLVPHPGIDPVIPGELRRVLVEHDLQPAYGLDPRQMRVLRDALSIDAVLDGAVLRFDDEVAETPRVGLWMRLRDAESGRVLWSATTERGGRKTRTVYDAGLIRTVEELADAALADLLSTWPR